jgi:L,D-transpeptidase ErfK/SrfK
VETSRLLLSFSAALITGAAITMPAAQARKADPIPPPAPAITDAVALSRVPLPLLQQDGLQLVLDRTHRQLMVLRNGQLLRRYPAAVGTTGWETPAGSFQVLEKQAHPVWEHPGNGRKVGPGETNPLGSRWIGFHRDCTPRKGWDGERYLSVNGCTVAGFHGTPHRWTVGRAVSHGCVRLYEEDVQEVFELVQVGTPVTVLP